MIGLARLADRGPNAAAAVAAGLLVVAFLLFPLIGVFMVVPITLSSAVVAFVILRRGGRAALGAGLICLLMLVAVSTIVLRSALAIPVAASFSWLPAILAALVLVRTSNLGLTVIATMLAGVLGIVGLKIVTGDPTEWWIGEVDRMLVALQASGQLALDTDAIDAVARPLAFWMTGGIGVSVLVTALAALFIARHWQAKLVNPGGFQSEFHALALGRNAALVTVVLVAVAAVAGGPVWSGIAMVAASGFLVQGLAVLHSLVQRRGLNVAWLAGVYLLLAIPQTWLMLAALGLVDNWIPLRRG